MTYFYIKNIGDTITIVTQPNHDWGVNHINYAYLKVTMNIIFMIYAIHYAYKKNNEDETLHDDDIF